MFVVSGDRHWQYSSRDKKTGLREFGCGPTTDQHAFKSNFKGQSNVPPYFNIEDDKTTLEYASAVGGFLEVVIRQTQDGGNAYLTFRHRSVDGFILNEKTFLAE